jgi:formylglycine-generating enzyme required for sulfatase activity
MKTIITIKFKFMKVKNSFFCLFLLLAIQVLDLNAQVGAIVAQHKQLKFTIKDIERSLCQVKDSLYASKYEVFNLQYRAFLFDLKHTGQNEIYEQAMVDTNVWITESNYYEPYIRYYFRHPGFNDFPVVGVSYEGANLFCQWLTQTYNNYPKREFKKVEFRLPTQEEWEYAASCGGKRGPYAWGGQYLYNSKGRALCNFWEIGDEKIYYDSLKNEFILKNVNNKKFIHDSLHYNMNNTQTVNYYFPNDFGFYNMCGNVAEMTLDKGIACGGSWKSPGGDVQVKSKKYYSKPTCDIGFRFFMVIIEK